MPTNQCCDCEEVHPHGVGLVKGRCPACLALFKERHAEAPVEPEPTEEQRRPAWWPPFQGPSEPAAEKAEEEQ